MKWEFLISLYYKLKKAYNKEYKKEKPISEEDAMKALLERFGPKH